jgi:hypothetical protein
MTDERKHSIDKLFHSSLNSQEIEPSAGVWKSLSKLVPPASSGGSYMFIITAIAIGALIFLLHSGISHNEVSGDKDAIALQENTSLNNPEPQTEAAAAIQASFNENESIAEAAKVNEQIASTTEDDDTETFENIENIETKEITGTTETIETREITETNKQLSDNPITSNQSNDAVTAVASLAHYANASVSPSNAEEENILEEESADLGFFIAYIKPKDANLSLNETRSIRGRESTIPLEPIFDLTLKNSYVEKANVLFGAGVSPAVNIYPDGQNRNDYSFDLVASYEKSRFIVETGLGASFSSESAKYQLNYTTYDSIGFYFGVSSFITDPANTDSIIFQTNLKSIYDSIDHFNIYENTNKYTYLQIPIRIGYRLIQKDRFSLDLKLGLLFSLQVYKDIPEVPYQGNDAEQIEVIRQYPDRLSTHWQYTAGISMNYQLNKHIRLSVEPFYRQYLKSVYSSGSSYSARSPYGFGIRGGIYFHF